MPIYEYQCGQCDHRMEKLQKVNEPPVTLCPTCNSPSLNKLISAAGFRLKGSGWYETDFKTRQRKNVSAEDKPATESDSAGKADAGKADAGKSASGGSSDGDGGKSTGKSTGKGAEGKSEPSAA